MRALLLFAVFALAACAATTPKDVEKMSTLDACYLAMMEPDKKPVVDAEMQRRQANCMDHEAELKKMADLEMRAGGSAPGAAVSGGAERQGGNMGGGRGY